MYHFFIGIDISKDSFVAALHGSKKAISYPYTKAGIKRFCQEFKVHLPQALVVLETTGSYETELLEHLQMKHYAVHRANTRHVKSFIRSYGTLAKTDATDALALALYGFERHSKLELYQKNPHKNLLKLVQRRSDLKAMLVQEKNRLQAPDQKEFKKSYQFMIKAIETEIANIEKTSARYSKAARS